MAKVINIKDFMDSEDLSFTDGDAFYCEECANSFEKNFLKTED